MPPPMSTTTITTSTAAWNSNVRGIFWLGVWFLLNLTINISNKYLLSHTNFHLPILLTVAHLVFNGIGAKIVLYHQSLSSTSHTTSNGIGEIPSTTSKNAQQQSTNNWILVLFTVVYCLNIAFGNICNKLVNLSFGTLFRSTIPIFIMVLSYIVMGSVPSRRVILAVIPIVVGVAITTQGEVEATVPSLIILVLGNTLSASKSVLSNRAMKEDNSNPVVLIDRLSFPSALLSLVFAYMAGEVHGLISVWGSLSFRELFFVVFTASVAFGLNWANFLAVKYTSALTMSVSANTKQVLVIVFGVVLFRNPVNAINMTGCVIAIVGMSWYSYVKYQESQQQALNKRAKIQQQQQPHHQQHTVGGHEDVTENKV